MKKGKEPQKGYNNGYVSFTPEELKERAAQDHLNEEAYGWLDRAMFTSSHIKAKDRKGGTVDIDDVYPVTAKETEEMRSCLDEAERTAGNPNEPIFKERLAELRGIVNWSSQRHRRWQWVLIAGVLLSLLGLRWMSSDAKDDVATSEVIVAQVEAWTEQDTTIVKEKVTKIDYLKRTESANLYKQYQLEELARFEVSSLEDAEEYIQRADTAKDESLKESLLKSAENSKESAQKYNKEYNEVNAMKYEEIHDMAMDEVERYLSSNQGSARALTIWTIFFIVLIPLYIFAERPYGYTITRTRLESKIMGGIQKFFIWLAVTCFGAGLAMNFVPDIQVKWSDGTRTTETDSTNHFILAMKLLLMALGAIIFCSISCFMMIYLTFQGLRRNFDWALLKAKVSSKTSGQK